MAPFHEDSVQRQSVLQRVGSSPLLQLAVAVATIVAALFTIAGVVLAVWLIEPQPSDQLASTAPTSLTRGESSPSTSVWAADSNASEDVDAYDKFIIKRGQFRGEAYKGDKLMSYDVELDLADDLNASDVVTAIWKAAPPGCRRVIHLVGETRSPSALHLVSELGGEGDGEGCPGRDHVGTATMEGDILVVEWRTAPEEMPYLTGRLQRVGGS